ncbi:DsbE family thiol:disulfide interchange protein [uncultured Roseobacter sp.]|uniref:DsbE family thiol:disulfide interchange protein n=1 Tax=uncultured Roseobacter sp. TaxID=114847 RepID=UPI00260D4C16|nr:DsbE family thiol:disulfide interchange protein [uncultured Roseobacter sp.]
MAKVSPLMIAPPLIFAGFLALAGVGMFTTDSTELRSTLIGKPAPAITETPLGDFPPVTPGAMATGAVTLVNFWASWCPPCHAEHPRLLEMAGQGMPIIGVNFKDAEGPASGYLKEDGNPFGAVAFDPQGRTAIDWGVTAPPETFILDAEGTVLFRFAGPLIGSDYEQRFLPELNKALGQ